MQFEREEVLTRLRTNLEAGKPIIGAGAGTGISAKCEEAGGVDLIVIYNSGRFAWRPRVACRHDAVRRCQSDCRGYASEVLPVVRDIPVLAGVCGTVPFRLMDVFLKANLEHRIFGCAEFPGLSD